MKKYLIISFIILGIDSCIEPYDFEIKGTERVLVVDATITNIPNTHYVRLAYSYALDGAGSELATGADVLLTDNQGNSFPFNEAEPGIYLPDPGFTGVIGRDYQLSIVTSDGRQYQSIAEKLLQPAQVDSIYGQFLLLPSETDGTIDRGVQFLVDIEGDDSENYHFRIEYEEDYEIVVPYPSLYVYNAANGSIDPRSESIRKCYINKNSQGLLIGTTSGQVKSELREFPVVYIEETDQELVGRYSLRINAFRISAQSYQYYKDLKENNESVGSFFDRQKGALIGNIQNVSNSNAPVLGYFEVASIAQGTKIFESGTWRNEGFKPISALPECNNQVDTVSTEDILNGLVDFDGRLIFTFLPSEEFLPGTLYNLETLLAPQSCSDCREYGKLEKPSFWN